MVKTTMSEDTLISVLVIAAYPQSFRKKDSRQAGMTDYSWDSVSFAIRLEDE